MPGQSAFICGIGLFSPVGGCTAQTATSVRAGISRYAESAVCNKHFMKMTMAMVPEEDLPVLTERADALPGLTARQRRMLRLAGPALEEALQPLPDGERVPLFLAGPEQLPERPEPVHEAFLDHLLAQAVVPIDRHCSKLGKGTRGRTCRRQVCAADVRRGQRRPGTRGRGGHLPRSLPAGHSRSR